MSLIFSSLKHGILNDIRNVTEYMSKPTTEDNYNKIIHGLYLGNYTAACSKSFLLNKEIDLVVNCSNNLDWPEWYVNFERPNFKYIRIPLDDSFDPTDQDIMKVSLERICPMIYSTININNQNVYVHCYAGMQRSATVIICYLMYKDLQEKKIIPPLKEYYKFLKEKRVVVFHPDPTFVKVIKAYYERIKELAKLEHN